MARKTGTVRHTHKYMRTYPYKNRIPIWICTLPECTHFLPTNISIEYKVSVCWGKDALGPNENLSPKCLGTVIMTSKHAYSDNTKYDKPVCNECQYAIDNPEEEIELPRAESRNEFIDSRIDSTIQKEMKERVKDIPDEIEVYYPIAEVQSIIPVGEHAPDCMAWFGESCTCGLE